MPIAKTIHKIGNQSIPRDTLHVKGVSDFIRDRWNHFRSVRAKDDTGARIVEGFSTLTEGDYNDSSRTNT